MALQGDAILLYAIYSRSVHTPTIYIHFYFHFTTNELFVLLVASVCLFLILVLTVVYPSANEMLFVCSMHMQFIKKVASGCCQHIKIIIITGAFPHNKGVFNCYFLYVLFVFAECIYLRRYLILI